MGGSMKPFNNDFPALKWTEQMMTQVDAIYLDLEMKRPVRVIGERRQHWTGSYVYHYPVEDILTGNTYYLPRKGMSEEALNEMEVLAWSSR